MSRLVLEHFAGNIIAAFLGYSILRAFRVRQSEPKICILSCSIFSSKVLLYSDRLSARGLGPVQPPEQGPGEADGEHPGRDQGQAHQVQQHLDCDWSILIT